MGTRPLKTWNMGTGSGLWQRAMGEEDTTYRDGTDGHSEQDRQVVGKQV